MGYNGSNRRFRNSVIKKSSFNFGLKLVTNLLAAPISIAASALLDSARSKKGPSKKEIGTHYMMGNKREIEREFSGLTEVEKDFLNSIKTMGFQRSKYISKSKPQLGSYVKHRGDGDVLVVIRIMSGRRYVCYDFVKDECRLYYKEDLQLD